jgi:hypothetical protein
MSFSFSEKNVVLKIICTITSAAHSFPATAAAMLSGQYNDYDGNIL